MPCVLELLDEKEEALPQGSKTTVETESSDSVEASEQGTAWMDDDAAVGRFLYL